MRWSSAIIGLVIGLAYAVVYLVLAFGAACTGIFFAAILPYGFGLLIFPIIGFLVGDLRPFPSKVLFVAGLVIHYTLVVNFLRLGWLRDSLQVAKMWNYSPVSIILPTAFYFLGKVVIWVAFIRSVTGFPRRASEQIVEPDRGQSVLLPVICFQG